MHEALDHTFINGIGCSDWMAERSAQQRFEELIPKLKEMGFGFLTVSQLFEKKGVTPSAHNGYIYTNVLQNSPAQYR